ncbi:MAG: MEDS domain-containing protein [Deltaproteobacteria bacterium]|nr:MEDS domain-containing protein [Deltaproteobacteria bacterium]
MAVAGLGDLLSRNHIALIYESEEEWQEAIVPFIVSGIENGEKCLYVFDENEPERVRRYLQGKGLDVALIEKEGRLAFFDSRYIFSPSETFDAESAVDFFITKVKGAIKEGFRGLRVTVEMTWILKNVPESKRILEYGSGLNERLISNYPCVFLCQFDRWKFDQEFIKGIILVHPSIMRRGVIYHNPYYLPPEDLLTEKKAAVEVDRWLQNIEREHLLLEELLRREERIKGIFDAAPIGLGLATKEGVMLEFNKRMTEITGYEPSELVGLNMNTLCAQIMGETEDGTVRTWEMKWKRKDGDLIDVLLSESWIDPRDPTKGKAFSAIDITKEKERERELLATREKLFQAQKMEAIGRLAGGIAHDFNNILTIILGNSELFLRSVPEDRIYLQRIKEIKEAAERGKELISQLLAFSRKQVSKIQTVNINDLIAKMEGMIRRLIGETIELSIRLSGEPLPVSVDPSLIQQALMNIVVNAVDAMPEGGELTIETSSSVLKGDLELEAGPYAVISIRDTGIGMSYDVRQRIFEPFFTTKDPGKGTGLGLFVTYETIKGSKGHIEVRSTPGFGSTFEIYLPLSSEGVGALERKEGKIERGHGKILVVEDNEAVRKVISELLSFLGYTVIEAKSPREALSLCESEKSSIDLVITDVVMPEISGVEMAREMRTKYPEVKVLFMSGYTNDVVLRHGISKEEIDYIQKPFQLEELARKVKEVLAKRESGRG